MDNQSSLLAHWSPRVLSILRIVVAFLIIQHGTQKLLGYPAQPPPPQPPPQAAQQAGQQPPQQRPAAQQSLPPLLLVASILETFGGLLILLGLFTRPAAFILAGEMAVAYFYQHAPNSFWPVVNRGEPAVFYCFLFLYIVFAGGGHWSLDYLMRRKGAE
ncbi:MAG TPA: DoxX family protein [Pyrinomonadaceae bacterium]|nr:DoxX family protein [Pyrinomonadaceae bacterium]